MLGRKMLGRCSPTKLRSVPAPAPPYATAEQQGENRVNSIKSSKR
jgi:hypothetical protein